jgi:hypothetical protein
MGLDSCRAAGRTVCSFSTGWVSSSDVEPGSVLRGNAQREKDAKAAA